VSCSRCASLNLHIHIDVDCSAAVIDLHLFYF